MAEKFVYFFGKTGTEGNKDMRNTLGGKGANLAEMATLGLPVPAGFTITCEFCNVYLAEGKKFTDAVKKQIADALKQTEAAMGMTYGDEKNPLLVSCRSGARASMPGMMETVLNVGLCSKTIPGMIAKSNERFVYDAYRRLIMMYSDVVMEKAEDIEPEEGKGIRVQLEKIMHELKEAKGYKSDTDMTTDDLKTLCERFKAKVLEVLGKAFPDDAMEQLYGGIGAVFKSWNGRRAISYRKIESIPDDWGTACNVQSMVFGNMGDTSATGVAFSRNPATGDNKFYGEWLINAQGEDVVAGIRTPFPINEETKNEQNKHLPSLETQYPALYKELHDIRDKLEAHFHDMQDIEFTIQEGNLYMLQCRNGKRTGTAAVVMAMDMLDEGLIDEKMAVLRVAPAQLVELLLPVLDPKEEKKATIIVKGLPAGPGGAVGKIVFTSEDAVAAAARGETVILIREETNPEDIDGMRAATGILTARGGMTSHAALVARGWGKCCIVGASDIHIDFAAKTVKIGGKVYTEGTVFTLNGTKGCVYAQAITTMDASENPRFIKFMTLADKYRTMGVRMNADSPADAKVGKAFGAEGIGLFRTEHMFYGKGSDEALFILRKMILAKDDAELQKAVNELFPFVKKSIKGTLEEMDGMPVTVRLLDPPLHEFVPQGEEQQKNLANALGITIAEIQKRGELLHEVNPMMGHRGIRLGLTNTAVTKMTIKAIFEASKELKAAGKNPKAEIMVPVTCSVNELKEAKKLYNAVKAEVGGDITIPYGTMIEIPRACLLADEMAQEAEFFSFGTNDLTQMTFGFSRDDIGGFLPEYLDKKVLKADPFQTIDQEGVGQLIQMAVQKGRSTRDHLKVGICGEQGGDPASVEFCFKAGLTYVSCSPFRVAIARLAAAHAAIKAGQCGCKK
ncbi:MAG: pyruvate, phosphate dikinase [Thermoguttaceae bacterium]|nr:pyruvate, phosphate dikinase [Thermoguttaceae bacterium]